MSRKTALAGVGVLLGLAVVGLRLTHSEAPPKPASFKESAGQPPLRARSAPDPGTWPAPPEAAALGQPNDPAVQALAAQLLNRNAPLEERLAAAHTLARLSSLPALAALRTALALDDSELRSAVAEALGECRRAEAAALLQQLAHDADELVACGAIRGIALENDARSAGILDEFLQDAANPIGVRTEACLALGEVANPDAFAALVRAANESTEPAVTEYALEGLGKRAFDETEPFFREFLATPGRGAEARAAALEALQNNEGDVAPLMLEYLADPQAPVRAAAAWALTTTDSPPDTGVRLMDALRTETSSEVRVRLYQAMATQEAYDASAVPALAQKETDPDSRLAALDLWAAASLKPDAAEVLDGFERLAIPELAQTAMRSDSGHQRLTAVMALARCRSPKTQAALQVLSRDSADPRVRDAANSALRPGSPQAD